jgi:hypothetical protein
VLNYFIVASDPKEDDKQNKMQEWLKYIKSMPTQVPDKELALVTGYSDCPIGYPNFTCILGYYDWIALNSIAMNLGVDSELPVNIQHLGDFNYDTLVWSALLIPASYRLHLLANNIWILASLGETDKRLKTAAAILAARQPNNPFFLYLHLGRDAQVQAVADKECSFPITQKDFSDWAWQRSEMEEAWKRSMVWDCVFIYHLLAGDAGNGLEKY